MSNAQNKAIPLDEANHSMQTKTRVKKTSSCISSILTFTIIVLSLIGALYLINYYALLYLPKYPLSESAESLANVRKELPNAENHWRLHNIENYDIDVSGVAHPLICGVFSDDEILPIHLTIRNSEIVFTDDKQRELVEKCNIRSFLPPLVFNKLKSLTDKFNSSTDFIEVTFDPVYGYVASYTETSNNNWSPKIIHYEFDNFQVIQSE